MCSHVTLCVGIDHTCASHTSQIMLAQIDLCHTVAEFANVGRELEAGVRFELDGAPLDEFPTQQLDRDGSCASDTHLRLVVFTWCLHERTFELVVLE